MENITNTSVATLDNNSSEFEVSVPSNISDVINFGDTPDWPTPSKKDNQHKVGAAKTTTKPEELEIIFPTNKHPKDSMHNNSKEESMWESIWDPIWPALSIVVVSCVGFVVASIIMRLSFKSVEQDLQMRYYELHQEEEDV